MKAWETPLHIIFLLLAGSLLPVPDLKVVALVAVYVVARAAAKGAGGAIAGWPLRGGAGARTFGLGLLSQGGVSIAIAVSVYLTLFAVPAARVSVETFFAAVVLGTVANEIIGPHALVQVLARAGETQSSGPSSIS